MLCCRIQTLCHGANGHTQAILTGDRYPIAALQPFQLFLCVGIGTLAVRRLLVFDAVGLLRNLLEIKSAGLALLGFHAFVQNHLVGRIFTVGHAGNQVAVRVVFLQRRLAGLLGHALGLGCLGGLFGGLDCLFS